jgi:putative endonuclease
MMKTGAIAEGMALAHLQSAGLRLVERNFRCRFGEIDLIMTENEALVFVEVRLRSNEQYGGAAESITPRKQQRIILAARYYLAHHVRVLPICRFDAVLLSSNHPVEWIRDAFSE